jgi:hypothetical protein
MKKDIPRSRKDYLIRHHLERTTGAGNIYIQFGEAPVFFEFRCLINIEWMQSDNVSSGFSVLVQHLC